ncbi:nickel-dependent hydrogenase large subunit [Lichenicola sp.]|uniref:nickel-dependent hydrogenase large subunit n=1 Tax=Lichenicola sp. TaxID=2804529 RepID=UPI003B00A2C9
MTALALLPAAMLIRAGTVVPASTVPRFMLAPEAWADLGERLLADPLPLATLWAEEGAVHALFLEAPDPEAPDPEAGDAQGWGRPLIASVPVEARRYLALSTSRPGISPCERMIRDMWGIEAIRALDLRPWLDHGHWGLTAPLSPRPGPGVWPPEPPEFPGGADDEAAGLFQLGLGPVQSFTTGAAHLRLSLDGERIARLEVRLGYGHRGVVRLILGRTPLEAAMLVSRIDAQATVAHGCAFARAVEAALGWRITARAEGLRAMMLELERTALHLHHLEATARQARLDHAGQLAAWLREAVLRGCAAAFGHRMMMDAVVPGGLAATPSEAGLVALPEVLDRLEASLPELRRSLGVSMGTRPGDATAARRLSGQAMLDPALASRCVFGGPTGDAAARCRTRLDEVARSAAVVRRLLLVDPAGPVRGDPPPARDLFEPAVEGAGMAMSVHGPVWHWLRIEAGRLSALHWHDPGLPGWQALEQAAVGLELDEFRLLCASIGLSIAGADR